LHPSRLNAIHPFDTSRLDGIRSKPHKSDRADYCEVVEDDDSDQEGKEGTPICSAPR
jgi:hypothetical protein